VFLDSQFVILTRLRTKLPESIVRFTVEVRDFPVARSVQTGSVVNLASCSADIRGAVLGRKATGP
jgi:hypothetical protein